MLKSKIKTLLLKISPKVFFAISSWRFYTYCKQRFSKFQRDFHQQLYGDKPISVLTGPFKDLQYYDRIVWGPITPKWLGTYESELHEVIQNIIERNYIRIMDVGAAEGYYSVGFAYKCPDTEVISYDVSPLARRRQKQLRELNDVRNLKIQGFCKHKVLSEKAGKGTLIFCDIEGGELDLLDPKASESLKSSDILVEIHCAGNFSTEEVSSLLKERFHSTHKISSLISSNRTPQSVPREVIPNSISEEVLQEAMNEYRNNGQEWLWMEAQT